MNKLMKINFNSKTYDGWKQFMSEMQTYPSPEELETTILEMTEQLHEEECQMRRSNIRILK